MPGIDARRCVKGTLCCVIAETDVGYVAPEKMSYVTQKLLRVGCYEVSLGDTIGMGTSGSIGNMLSHVTLEEKIPG